MKRLIPLFLLSLCMAFVSCNDDYDADSAQSLYVPVKGRHMVASVKTTENIQGREFVWEHKFSYDAHGRIKTINSDVKAYERTVLGYLQCNIISNANYYYKGEGLDVVFDFKLDYPDYPSLNFNGGNTDSGSFNRAGVLARFGSLELEYSTTQLQRAYSTGDVYYDVLGDGNGNVAGYNVYNTHTGDLIESSVRHFYSSSIKNNTNFDFSAYFGYWGVEQAVGLKNKVPYYAVYQLAAFGMMGTTSAYLPFGVLKTNESGASVQDYGDWSFDEKERPVLYVDTEGRKSEFTYYD